MVDVAAVDSQVSLLFRVGPRLCALPVAHVIETMRPLPMEVIAGAPPYVGGLAIVRGTPIPVVILAALLGAVQTSPGRLVVLRTGGRRVAIAVDEVVGFGRLPTGTLHELPPLLGEASRDVVAEMGALDGQLLLVLKAAGLVPEALLADFDQRVARP